MTTTTTTTTATTTTLTEPTTATTTTPTEPTTATTFGSTNLVYIGMLAADQRQPNGNALLMGMTKERGCIFAIPPPFEKPSKNSSPWMSIRI